MLCNMENLCRKEVINICNGNRIGYIRDVNIETCNAEVCSFIVEPTGFSLFQKKNSTICIPWNAIKIIGKETVLVEFNSEELQNNTDKNKLFSSFLKK